MKYVCVPIHRLFEEIELAARRQSKRRTLLFIGIRTLFSRSSISTLSNNSLREKERESLETLSILLLDRMAMLRKVLLIISELAKSEREKALERRNRARTMFFS